MDEVVRRFEQITSPQVLPPGTSPASLTGWIKGDRFQLIIRQRRLNSFMPLVEGRIDPTSTGCLIFLNYKLMPFTRMYLVLWSVIAIISGVVLTYQFNALAVGIGSVAIVILIHVVAWANLKMHMKTLHQIIFKMLE
jgi:hypothetical protein